MIFQWETQEERLLRFMRISPKKKLEWLYQMNVFLNKALTNRQKYMHRLLRERR